MRNKHQKQRFSLPSAARSDPTDSSVLELPGGSRF